jgi:hypothetical protein
VTAAIFLLTALTSMFAAFALEPGLYAPDYLARIFPNKKTVVLAAPLWSFHSRGVVLIAVFGFPLPRNSMKPGGLPGVPLSQQFLDAVVSREVGAFEVEVSAGIVG